MGHHTDIDTNIIQLSPGENPLWSHLYPAPPENKLSATTQRNLNYALRACKVTAFGFIGLQLWKNRERYGSDDIFIYALIAVIAGLCIIAARFIKWRPLQDRENKDIYKNAVITDQRIIFYNHDGSSPIIIQRDDVVRASIDYERGGLALKIYRRSAANPAILIGTATFKEALAIIQQEYLSS